MHYSYFNVKLTFSQETNPCNFPLQWNTFCTLGSTVDEDVCLQVLIHSLSVLFQFHLLKLPLKFWSVYNMTVSWFGFFEPQYPLQLCPIWSVIHLLLVLEAAWIFLPLDNHWRIWGLCYRNDACSCRKHGILHLDRPLTLKKKVKSSYY